MRFRFRLLIPPKEYTMDELLDALTDGDFMFFLEDFDHYPIYRQLVLLNSTKENNQ